MVYNKESKNIAKLKKSRKPFGFKSEIDMFVKQNRAY